MDEKDIIIIVLVLAVIGLIWKCTSGNNRAIPNDGSLDSNRNNQTNTLQSSMKNPQKHRQYLRTPVNCGSVQSDTVQSELLSDSEEEVFQYKKRDYVKRDIADVEDMYNPDNLLPQDTDEDFFDLGALQDTKTIRNSHLIHPKKHTGVNTVSTRRKNPSRDIRGEIPIQKTEGLPWMMSSIDPDEYNRGLCN